MNVYKMIALFAVLVVISVSPSLLSVHDVAAQALPGRSNIVVIMADDLDVPTLEAALANGLMPSFQNYIAAKANIFRNSFVTNSLCCPSRATFLTGQYSHNHGTLSNFPPNGGISTFDDTSTFATWLQSGGYRTGYVGKYLNGYGFFTDANRDGVITAIDFNYVPPGWDDWQALTDPGAYQVYGYRMNDNGTNVRYGYSAQDYQTDVLARRSGDFIRESSADTNGAPFFLCVAPLVPHDEIGIFTPSRQYSDVWRWRIRPAWRHAGTVTATLPQRPSFNEADVSDKPQWVQNWPSLTSTDIFYKQLKERARLAAMRSFDDLIGSVATALEDTGQLDNTVLLFTSDNGWHFGEHRLGGKMTAYEESIRVPLYITLPGTSSSQTLHQFALNTDLAPTIAELAQVDPELPVDGRSLLPLINDSTLPWRKRFLVEHFKSIDHIMEIPTFTAIRTASSDRDTPNQLYVEYQDEWASQEHYDLQTDPFQMGSLHADQSTLRSAQRALHRQRLSALKSCGNGSCQVTEWD